MLTARFFLAAWDHSLRLNRLGIRSQALVCGFAYTPPYTFTPGQPSPGRAALLRHPFGLPTAGLGRVLGRLAPKGFVSFVRLASPGSAWAHLSGYGNINPLSIDYACRPRLRPRLTLGGLACPRNPWSSGGNVSHVSFATHACILTRPASTARSPCCFARRTALPYPAQHALGCRGFGGVLEPRYIVGAESLDQ